MAIKEHLEKIEYWLSGWRGIAVITATVALVGIVGLLWWLNRGDWVYPEQINSTQVMPHTISTGHTIGQTFVAKQAGLQGIGIKVAGNGDAEQGAFRLRLYANPDANEPILETSVNATLSPGGTYIYFRFPPQPDSRFHYYYFTVDLPSTEKGIVANVFGAPLSAYLDGSAYADGSPFDAQLALHLNYERGIMAGAIIQNIIFGMPAALATLIMLLIPGGALLVWVRPKLTLDGIEWLAVAVGVSLAVIPVLMTYLRYVPLALTSGIVWATYGAAAILLVLGIWRQRPLQWRTMLLPERRNVPAYVAFMIVFLVSLVVRLQVVTGLEIPLWADSYHHTIISQLIVDNGKIVTNWEPYAPLTSLNYHYGFHTMVAVFHWLTGLPVPKSVIFFGQILNTLAVLMAYLLGRRLGENVWVGVIAALVTGLLSKYPMYYVNWGRYTQLAGQVLLPVLVVLTWAIIREGKKYIPLLGVTGLLIAGLALTHYRVILFWVVFVFAATVVQWAISTKRMKNATAFARNFTVVGVFSAVLILPRVAELVGSRLWVLSRTIATQGNAITFISNVYNAMGSLFDFLPPWVVLSAFVGLAINLWLRKSGVAVLWGWWLGLLILANPQFFLLPGTGVITNFAIFIGAYMIFSVMSAEFFVYLMLVSVRNRRIVNLGMFALAGLFALIGFQGQTKMVDLSSVLVTSADIRAMEWLRENTPATAKFVVNSRTAYGGTSVVGLDGGWWLPYLTGREAFVPPMIYNSEHTTEPDFAKRTAELSLTGANLSTNPDETLRFWKAHGYSFVYIGQQRGQVWQENAEPIDPDLFNRMNTVTPLYAQDGVRIFKLR